jgi:hypothetical protein
MLGKITFHTLHYEVDYDATTEEQENLDSNLENDDKPNGKGNKKRKGITTLILKDKGEIQKKRILTTITTLIHKVVVLVINTDLLKSLLSHLFNQPLL